MAEMRCQSSRPGRFISGEGAASTHRIRHWGNPEWRLWRKEKSYATREWNSFLITDFKVSFARHSVYIRPAGLSDCLRRYVWSVMVHSRYSSDLAPRDFHFFGPLKKDLIGKRFASDANVNRHLIPISST
jgi:hypothetical protein